MKKPVIHQYSDGRTAELTDENINTFDENTQVAYRALREIEGKVILTNKYFHSLKTIIKYEWLKELLAAYPAMPMNVVVAKVVERLPHFIPGDKIVELTKYVIAEWEKSEEKKETASVK